MQVTVSTTWTCACRLHISNHASHLDRRFILDSCWEAGLDEGGRATDRNVSDRRLWSGGSAVLTEDLRGTGIGRRLG